MAHDQTLRHVRISFIKLIWLLGVAPLALLLAFVLFNKLEIPLAWESQTWIACIFLLPSAIWLACWLKNKHSGLMVFGAIMLGFGVAAPLFYVVGKAVWIDHQLLTLPLASNSFDGSVLGLCAVAGLTECIRYCILTYALSVQERPTEKSVFLTCTSLAMGCAAGSLFCLVAFDQSPLVSTIAFEDFSRLFIKELAMASLWTVALTRRFALTRIERTPWLVDLIWLLLLAGAQTLLTGLFQLSTISWLPLLIASLIAIWGPSLILRGQEPNGSSNGFSNRMFALTFFLMTLCLISYRILASPQTTSFKVKGLSFDHPTHWLNQKPDASNTEEPRPFAMTQKPNHFEIVSPSDVASRIEVRIADKYEGAMLKSSLHMQRASRYGDHQWIVHESHFDHGGRDWHRTHFTYPYHFGLGTPAEILHGIEYAIVDGKHLYVVTVHAREDQTKSIDSIVSRSLQSSAVE